jgi:predicted adenylyl cyclase CyaB
MHRRRNIELKVRVPNLHTVRERAAEQGALVHAQLHQEDHYFPAPGARLKVRCLGDGGAELIAYSRPNAAGARGSNYILHPVTNASTLLAALSLALPQGVVVVKARTVLLLRNTRIHLDRVDGLGEFVELETVLRGQCEEDAWRELREIAALLGLPEETGIPGSYVDLLLAHQAGATPPPGDPPGSAGCDPGSRAGPA